MTEPLYPLLLQPTLHVKVWGGRKLADTMRKALPTVEPYGESWELHDTSTVLNGAMAGRTLGSVLEEYGTALIGGRSDPAEGMPLLAKFIDALDWLSVQVHPDDAQAAELEGEPRGKTEAWYILAAEPGAKLVIGVRPGTTREAMAQAIRDNTLESLLVMATVHAGDLLYIPAGTIHAIGPGILLYEIQQSSDTTYRLYDWGRLGLDGQPRPLHIDKGVRVSRVESLPQITHPGTEPSPVVTVVTGDFFTTTLHRISGSSSLNTAGQYFHALTCIAGLIEVAASEMTIAMQRGDTALIPAAIGSYVVRGNGEMLRSRQGGA